MFCMCSVLSYRRATCVLYVCCAVLQEGNVFCTTLEPRLFTIDLNTIEHKVFFTELLNLCEAEDGVLLKLPCYKTVTDLVPLRKSAMGTYVYEYVVVASCSSARAPWVRTVAASYLLGKSALYTATTILRCV